MCRPAQSILRFSTPVSIAPRVSCLRFTQTLLAALTCLTMLYRAVKVGALIHIKRKMCCAEEGAVDHERDRAKGKEDSEEK